MVKKVKDFLIAKLAFLEIGIFPFLCVWLFWVFVAGQSAGWMVIILPLSIVLYFVALRYLDNEHAPLPMGEAKINFALILSMVVSWFIGNGVNHIWPYLFTEPWQIGVFCAFIIWPFAFVSLSQYLLNIRYCFYCKHLSFSNLIDTAKSDCGSCSGMGWYGVTSYSPMPIVCACLKPACSRCIISLHLIPIRLLFRKTSSELDDWTFKI